LLQPDAFWFAVKEPDQREVDVVTEPDLSIRADVQGVAVGDGWDGISDKGRKVEEAPPTIVEANQARLSELGVADDALIEIAQPYPPILGCLHVLDAIPGVERTYMPTGAVVDMGIAVLLVIGTASYQKPLALSERLDGVEVLLRLG
jgi:hypothetical protein